jgi:hypothetical protein
MTEFKFPTEIVELPSKGLVYPPNHPLRKGTVEMKYMSAREEDILTNQNYISKGVVLDKLLEALTLGKIDIHDIITGDKNALLVASRILGYGKDYTFNYKGKEHVIDLSTLDNKPFDETLISNTGTFTFTLPKSENIIEFKILTEKENKKVEEEILGYKKINKDSSSEITTRLKHQIVSINGDTDKTKIKEFIDNYLLAPDSRALRLYMNSVSPDVNLTYQDSEEAIDIPINLNFFWPDL